MSQTPSSFIERINQVKQSGATELDLTNHSFGQPYGRGLTTFPHEVLDLPHLTSLNLRRNSLVDIPESIRELRSLTSLNLSSNLLPSLPNSLSALTQLQSLDISGNSLREIPEWFSNFSKLTFFNVSHNRLTDLPASLYQLTELTHLDLSGNFLTAISERLAKLKKLTILNLSNNRLSGIPAAVYELSSLESLSLMTPRRILTENDNENRLKEISPKILQLHKLAQLQIDPSGLEIPPPEVGRLGLANILDYFRQLQSEGEAYLYEAKLLIVGEGGAGKTTLAKKIADPKYQLQREDSTKGIEVLKWNFPFRSDKTFQVNVWDFGGQEIYHATHQFFLTKRSLYILVADTRKEDTDFYYWLNVVELLSDSSPLLVVKNEKQDRRREINERQLRGQFSNLKATFGTNLATNRGLTEIVDEIKHYVTHLPHVGAPLPKTWVKVRQHLERESSNYISQDEYLSICERNGFTDLKTKLQLSSYLHDLGVCLHFQDDPILKKTVILKPKWGTDAVYKVLDNATVISNLGRFSRANLAEVWSEPEYDNMQDELLQLMIKFKLCYQIPETQSYIAPQLLTSNQPEYEWSNSENLTLRYSYEFMPKGIVTQFIVAMHKLISDQRLAWRTGVVIFKDETQAEVIENYGKREITVRVAGAQKRELLSIVNFILDNIHSSYKRLKYTKLIPCNCNVCQNNSSPHFYHFEVLRRALELREEKIQCQMSFEMVNVRPLIDDISNSLKSEEPVQRVDSGFVFHGPVQRVVIQQADGGTNVVQQQDESKRQLAVRSAWANGTFYVFTFAIVIAGLGLLAKSVSGYTLIGLLTAGIIFVPLIGALQLRQDDRLSERSFLTLMRMVIGQLPLIGRFFKMAESTSNPE